MKNSHYDNETAAGAILTLVIAFFLCGAMWVFCGFAVDKISSVAIGLGSTLPTSQMRWDVFKIELLIFQFEPILILLGAGIAAWVDSIRQYSGDIEIGRIAFAGVEVMIVTLVVIAITLFGGAGLESVINVVNHMPIAGGGQPALFSAVQYVGPVVYGVMVLVIVGACINFLINAVQTIDVGTMW